MVRTAAVALAGFAAMGVTAACEPAACTTHFAVAAPVGSWDDPASWDTGAVPTETDIACVGAGWKVQLAGDEVTVKGLKTASPLFLIESSLTILNKQIEGAATGAFFVGAGSSITIGGGTGNLTLDGGALAGSGDVYGSVSGVSSVSPGDPGDTGVGVFTVHGDLALDTTYVPIDLSGDGKVAGVGHDRIAVTGAFSATEQTLFDPLPGPTFVPVARTTISPVTVGSGSSVQANVNIPIYDGSGKHLERSFGGTGVDVYVTDCDPAVFGPSTTYTTSLANKDLRLCPLQGSSFAGVDLSGTDLSDAILTDASFTSANLTGADLRRAQVGGANLATATLTGLRSGSTQGVPVLPPTWKAVGGYLIGPGANLAGVDLSALDLTGASFAALSFAGANLTGANLSGLDLTGKRFTGATLTGANLTGTNLTNATLALVRSGGIVGTPTALPTLWQLRSGFLVGQGANLTGANLVGVDLTGTELIDADLTGANLTGADVTGAKLLRAKLNANLTSLRSGGNSGIPSVLPFAWVTTGGFLVGPTANLSGKTLYGVNLTSVNVSFADFTNATLDSSTVSGSNWTGTKVNGIKGRKLTGLPSVNPPSLEVMQGYFFGPNVNLSGEVLVGLDLSDRVHSLAGANLTGGGITSSNLYRLQLQGANLTGAGIADSTISQVNMTGANMGGLPVGATFGGGLMYAGSDFTFTPPAGWVLEGTGIFGIPPYQLRRVS